MSFLEAKASNFDVFRLSKHLTEASAWQHKITLEATNGHETETLKQSIEIARFWKKSLLRLSYLKPPMVEKER